MIVDVSRGHIKAEVGGRAVTLPGEMFFPKNGKMGFVIFRDQIKYWDDNDVERITDEDVDRIIEDVRAEFAGGGNVLEVE